RRISYVVLVSLQQRADPQRRMPAEIGDVLAGLDRVRLSLIRLAAQPADNRNAVMAEDHEAVMQVAHQARELELENVVERLDDLCRFSRTQIRFHWRLRPWNEADGNPSALRPRPLSADRTPDSAPWADTRADCTPRACRSPRSRSIRACARESTVRPAPARDGPDCSRSLD